MIFTLDSIHQMPQRFIIQQNIFVFTMAYPCNNIFILCAWSLCCSLIWQWSLTLTSPWTKSLWQIQNLLQFSKFSSSFLVITSSLSKCFFFMTMIFFCITIIFILLLVIFWDQNTFKTCIIYKRGFYFALLNFEYIIFNFFRHLNHLFIINFKSIINEKFQYFSCTKRLKTLATKMFTSMI